MTPKEKAIELFNNMLLNTGNDTFAKKCGLIAVNEIIKFATFSYFKAEIDYWTEVKQEIEKL